MPDIVIVRAREMPMPDRDTPLLVEELELRGISSEVRPWGDGTDWSAAPVALVRSTWDYFLQPEDFLAWIRRTAPVTRLVNQPDMLVWNAHKRYLLDLAVAGVPVVDTTIVPLGAAHAAVVAALTGPGEVVVKPAIGAGALRSIRTAAGSPEAVSHLATLVEDGDALVQPFVPSVLSKGEISMLYFGGQFSHAVRKVPAPGDYRVQVLYGGSLNNDSPTVAESEVGARVLAALPHPPVYARVDLVDVDGAPRVMEVELIEPELFLYRDEASAGIFADHLAEELSPS